MDLSIYLWYYSAVGIYFSFRWGPFVHSLEIVQWDSTRRDHPGYPGRVSGSGLVSIDAPIQAYVNLLIQSINVRFIMLMEISLMHMVISLGNSQSTLRIRYFASLLNPRFLKTH